MPDLFAGAAPVRTILVPDAPAEPMLALTQLSNYLTLEGSFSSVSTATIARKDACCSIFKDGLQDLHSFAPLESVE